MTLKEISNKNIKKGRFITLKVESPIVKNNRFIIKSYIVNGRFGVDYTKLKQSKGKEVSKSVEGKSWFTHTDMTSIVRAKNYPYRYYLQLMNPKYFRVKFLEYGKEISAQSLLEDKIITPSSLKENLRPTTTISIENIREIIYKNS